MIERKGLPTMLHRWCCKIFKENAGAGSVVLTGVRAEESRKRAGYNVVDVRSTRKEHQQRAEPYTIEGIEAAQHQCIKGKDKVMVYPMLEWTTTDVWVFIASRRLPVNPCYEISGRVGCMFCPFAKKEQIEFYERRYPQFHRLFLDGLRRYMEKIDKYGITSDEYYAIWKSKKSIKDYLRDKANKDAARRQTELFQNENWIARQ
ncbi:MAG: phosphoadenosine phosphosulfate reductase family protein [Bacteroidales bacterium]|nr:phosphoadenosine phosphosulfate reductase family protein [Bacteroidales bacterium]